MTNLAIIGSRSFTDWDLFKLIIDENFLDVLDGFNQYKFKNIVSGAARGVDEMAARLSKEKDINLIEYPADWYNLEVENCVVKIDKTGEQYNALAGFNRNNLIIEAASHVLGIWDGSSKGTKHSLNLASKLKKNTTIIYI